jgi:hypothetical protein
VLPVALRFQSASGMALGFTSPWGIEGQLFRYGCELWKTVEVTTLPLRRPAPDEVRGALGGSQRYARRVSEELAAALGVPPPPRHPKT